MIAWGGGITGLQAFPVYSHVLSQLHNNIFYSLLLSFTCNFLFFNYTDTFTAHKCIRQSVTITNKSNTKTLSSEIVLVTVSCLNGEGKKSVSRKGGGYPHSPVPLPLSCIVYSTNKTWMPFSSIPRTALKLVRPSRVLCQNTSSLN